LGSQLEVGSRPAETGPKAVAEQVALAANRVTAVALGVHARTGLKKHRSSGGALTQDERLAVIRAAALKGRVRKGADIAGTLANPPLALGKGN
jgi:hypothetical protein